MRRAAVVLALAGSSAVHADTDVAVRLSLEGDRIAQELGISPAELAAQIKARVDEVYETANLDAFLGDFTDATSFSARGLGVDYASAPRGFLAGIAANVAAAGDGDLRSEVSPSAGLAANLAVMVGMNLREWNAPRWTVFANGFWGNASTDWLDGEFFSVGGHVMYHVLPPAPGTGTSSAVLRWIGLSVTSGVEVTRWKLGTDDDPLTASFDVTGSRGGMNLTLDTTGRLDLTSTTATFPVEVTTGIRIALVSTLYVGAGIDLSAGSSEIEASLAGSMRAADGSDVGDVAIGASDASTGSPVTARILAGVQLNLWKLKLFGQVNASQVPAASVAFGLRFVQ